MDSANNVLKDRRAALRLTQKQAAERAHITLQHYQAFEGGQRNIMTASFRTACRVIRALEMSVDEFFDDAMLPTDSVGE